MLPPGTAVSPSEKAGVGWPVSPPTPHCIPATGTGFFNERRRFETQYRLLLHIIRTAGRIRNMKSENRRRIEREFGVPIAGAILEPARWTQTALKKLPPDGPLDLTALFGRRAPLIVDLGCGNGRFLIGSALWRPQFDHLGIDVLPLVLRYATRRANQRGLANLRLAAIDGQAFTERYLPPESVQELHCYHPQPYHDPRDAHKRLIFPTFLANVCRVLMPGGQFFVQTDNEPYWQYIRSTAPHFFDFQEQPRPWPDAPKGRTRREIIALRRGLPVYRGWGTVRADLGEAALGRLTAELPLPTFDAGPTLREIEELERE
jgi:tRNA (guanine-N7-)-methyltransferase